MAGNKKTVIKIQSQLIVFDALSLKRVTLVTISKKQYTKSGVQKKSMISF